MPRWILLGLFAAMTLPAGAAKRVTVAQLEQALAAATAAHKADAGIARMIAGMELSERLSESALERIDSRLNAGPQAMLAMQLLADESAFLNLPSSELPATAAPDQAAQLRMFDAAAHYVADTLTRLPNFLSTRTTKPVRRQPPRVEEGSLAGTRRVASGGPVEPGSLGSGGSGKRFACQWLRCLGGSTGAELLGRIWHRAGHDPGRRCQRQSELEPLGTDWIGPFGCVPLLSAQICFAFRAAPFRCGTGVACSGYIPRTYSAKAGSVPEDTIILHDKQGYEGSLWLDPVTGTILRITIEADSKGNAAYQRAAMLVEYGAVEIAGSRFILPVRSLAFSTVAFSAEMSTGDAPSEWLNETLFTGYHRFASTTRIVAGEAAPQ